MSNVAVGTAGLARRGVRDIVRTVYIHSTLVLALVGVLLLAGPVLLLAAYTVDRRRRWTRRLVRAVFPRMIRHYCWLGGTPMAVDLGGLARELGGGRDGQPKGCTTSDATARDALGPAIVVANHGSSLDSILLMMLPLGLGDGRVWAKGWPFKMPLLGALMSLSGHLLVEDFNLLPDAEDSLADGESLLVFPESSRSRTGRVGRFRDGAFLLAVRTGRPIIPVAVHGSFACFPPGQPWVFRPRLKVEALGILRPEAMGHGELKQAARDMIEAAMERHAGKMGRG